MVKTPILVTYPDQSLLADQSGIVAASLSDRSDNPKGINNNNRLVVTARDFDMEDFDYNKSYFYLGLYEEYEGKINIKNPDPYAKDKYIVKDIDPIFVAPIVALVRPGLIERDVIAKEKIRDHHKVFENLGVWLKLPEQYL